MADNKPIEVHSVTLAECVDVAPFWNALHMPCWVCNAQGDSQDLVFNEFCEVYFHRECLVRRS